MGGEGKHLAALAPTPVPFTTPFTQFRDGVAEEYDGPRDADGIIAHISKLSAFQLPRVTKLPDLLDLKALGQPILIGVFREPVKASAAFKVFSAAAFELSGRGITMAYSSAPPGTDPVAPIDAESKPPPVPGLLFMHKGGSHAAATLPLPRKRDEFDVWYISKWLRKLGLRDVEIRPKDGEQPKSYYPDIDQEEEYTDYNQAIGDY